ncbi:hypothetical protein [Hyphomonas sp.]|uniref:hypothetical protein n=1 Tax=Hyphomonas sp. TaxID=87 RepID=UPI0025C23CB7|nr:hypothetical protein [Hyphomonas sp.]
MRTRILAVLSAMAYVVIYPATLAHASGPSNVVTPGAVAEVKNEGQEDKVLPPSTDRLQDYLDRGFKVVGATDNLLYLQKENLLVACRMTIDPLVNAYGYLCHQIY